MLFDESIVSGTAVADGGPRSTTAANRPVPVSDRGACRLPPPRAPPARAWRTSWKDLTFTTFGYGHESLARRTRAAVEAAGATVLPGRSDAFVGSSRRARFWFRFAIRIGSLCPYGCELQLGRHRCRSFPKASSPRASGWPLMRCATGPRTKPSEYRGAPLADCGRRRFRP